MTDFTGRSQAALAASAAEWEARNGEREVARLRLPVTVSALGPLNEGLTCAYGEGLTLQQQGEWLVVLQPIESLA